MIAIVIAAGVLIVAGAIVWSARLAVTEWRRASDAEQAGRALTILTAFAPGIAAAQQDPRAMLVWQPLARAARGIAPDVFAQLDRAAGATFPFSTDQIQSAHSHWTAEWLAWERTHDAEYKRRAAEAQSDRVRLDIVEREKLDSYQRRYEEYVRIVKALQALIAK